MRRIRSIHSSRLRSNAAVKRRRAGSCARTICVVPVMPPAPGRFSITTGWPSALARLLLMARMAPSPPEPADSGKMMRRGRSPRLWARTRPTGASAAAPKAAAPKHRARGRTGDPARKMLRCRQHRGAQSLWAGRWVSSWSCLRCCCESGAGRALSVRRTGPLRLPVVPVRPRRPLAAGPAPARACSPALASGPPCAGPAPGAAGARPGAGRSWPGAAAWCGRFARRARHRAG